MLSSQNKSHSPFVALGGLLSVLVIFSIAFTGCSKPEVEKKKEEKKVVQELNIQTPEESKEAEQAEPEKDDSAMFEPTKATPVSHKGDEVEEIATLSLDLSDESEEEVEEELPILGSGG